MPGYSLDWPGFMLTLQGALVGHAPPALRAVLVTLKPNEEAHVICYFDGPISEDDEEDMQLTHTEMLAAYFPDYSVSLETQRLDSPTPLPRATGNLNRWAYARSGEL